MTRLVLAGAGHSHALVLLSLVKRAIPGTRVTLISPHDRMLYSGMFPGLVAGHYRREETEIDFGRLGTAAGVEFMRDSVAGLDAANRVVRLSDGSVISYDVLSLNIGSLARTSAPGSAEHALPAKPFDAFLVRVAPHLQPQARLAIGGGGVAGVELAMALRHRAGCAVTLYSANGGFPPRVERRIYAAVKHRGVTLRENTSIEAVEQGPVVVAGGKRERYDLVVWTTGAAPAAWPRQSGLATDERGFVLVDRALRSISHPQVFAAGDCATLQDGAHAKSGVYAVRHGAVLAENLRRALQNDRLAAYTPQRRALVLIGCGEPYAIAAWGGWSWEGEWVWRWKERIDRLWLRRFRQAS